MAIPNTRNRYLFFTGKGGVGKTSLSCATGLALAESGRQVLIVSTDPASNLDEMLGVALSQTPTAIPGAPGLFALNIDPEAAAHAYCERMVAPYRGLLPAAAIALALVPGARAAGDQRRAAHPAARHRGPSAPGAAAPAHGPASGR
ncbi:MAG: ArsA-related P-loop ATPase [Thermochromatium sp.]